MTAGARSSLLDAGSGPPLLVFHGWSGSKDNVARWLPALAPRFRVLAPDLPGCNGVAPLDRPHTARAYAAWGLARADDLGLGRFRVAGLCSGTAIAIALAELAPERVGGLLLHTPFLRPSLIRPVIRAQLALLASPLGVLFAPLSRSGTLAALHRRLFANAAEVEDAQLAHDQADLLRADVGANRELARDLLRVDRTAALRACPAPIAVLLAESDAFVDAAATASLVGQLAPHALVATIAGGHGWTPAFVRAQHDALARLGAALA